MVRIHYDIIATKSLAKHSKDLNCALELLVLYHDVMISHQLLQLKVL